MPEPRLIKRYANRKMYDTEQSCYVTLTEVAGFVRAGEDVRVIDNRTKADLTEVTLTQALLDSERRKKGSVSLDGLRTLISSGGDFLQHRIAEPVSKVRTDAERKVEHWRSEAQNRVGRVLHRDADGEQPVEGEDEPALGTAQGNEDDDTKAGINSLVEQTQRAYDDIQHRIDERVRLVVSALTQSSAVEQELVALRQQVEALQDRVSVLEAADNAE